MKDEAEVTCVKFRFTCKKLSELAGFLTPTYTSNWSRVYFSGHKLEEGGALVFGDEKILFCCKKEEIVLFESDVENIKSAISFIHKNFILGYIFCLNENLDINEQDKVNLLAGDFFNNMIGKTNKTKWNNIEKTCNLEVFDKLKRALMCIVLVDSNEKYATVLQKDSLFK